MILLQKLPIERVDKAIEMLTGILPEDHETDDRFLLTLGHEDPIEIGYDKTRHGPELDYKYMSRVKCLECISELMKSGSEFLIWTELNRK